MKLVSQLDAARYFVCPAWADESPREPGVFPLPGGCVDVEPPQVPEGKRARFVDGAFVLEDMPLPPAPQPDPQPTSAEIVARVMLGMKSRRLDIFRVLDSLQNDALTDGNQLHAQAIKQAKAALTALNNIDLSGYQTAEAMEQAIQQSYWDIVALAPQEVQDNFNALVPR